MNMRQMYNRIKSTKPKSNLETYAIREMLQLFPEPPTTGAYATYEETGYNKAYDVFCPDQELDDYDHYREWLEQNGVKQTAEQDYYVEKYKKIELINTHGFLD